jgi:hypothetical protein
MLKLNASYSKKVPVDGTDFSSHSYLASVEVEIPDGLSGEQLQQRIHDTFGLVRDSVEAELNGGNHQPRRFPQKPANQPQAASGKQLGYLRDMALKQGMSPRQLDDEVRELFGVSGLRDLTRQQASELIEQLGGNSRRQSRKAA